MGLRSGDWLGHSRTLMCFLLDPLLCCLGRVFWAIVMLEYHPRPIFNVLAGFNALALTEHGPVHCPFNAVQLSCPLSRKTPTKYNVSTSIFDGGDGVLGVLGSIPPPPNMAVVLSWCQRTRFWSHLTTTLSPSSPLNHSDVHWQTSDGPIHMLSWAGGPFRRCRISVFHGTLFPHRSHNHWNSAMWDLAWSPSPREIDSYFVFVPFVNNRTNCCHRLTKLLGDGLVAHSSLV